MGKGPEQTPLQGGHTEGPETQERMLSITSHQKCKLKPQRDTTSHWSEWSSLINEQTTSAGKDIGHCCPSTLLVGMQTGAATVESSMEFPQKTKNEQFPF